MSKELREMLDSINNMKAEIKNLYAEGKDADAQAKMDELEALQSKFENLLKLEDTKVALPKDAKPIDDHTDMEKFVASMRLKFRDQMSEGTPAAGGYTVPSDIQTKVNQYKKTIVSLEDLITVEKVSEPTGSRVYQTKAQAPIFATVEEAAAIGAGTDPAFEQINYACEKRGAIFTVTDELLADSDADIQDLLAKWIAESDVRTTNTKIIGALNTLTATAIDGIDGIKHAVNVTLGQTYKNTAVVLTNDSGLNYLDTLKDKNGRYLLTPDLNNPGQLRLSCGAISVPVKVAPDSELANPAAGSFPFYVGDLKEFMRKYDLQKYTIKLSDNATVNKVSAFENDLTYFRVTERNDFQKVDADAVARLTLTPATPTP
jgi:HK97 family phage major capsid protein